jgi:hypothetical protein
LDGRLCSVSLLCTPWSWLSSLFHLNLLRLLLSFPWTTRYGIRRCLLLGLYLLQKGFVLGGTTSNLEFFKVFLCPA